MRGTFGTMFDFTKSEFDDQWKSIMMLLDRTNVLNDEFGKKAKEAIERVSAAPADLQRRQQEGADHLQAQAADNRQRDVRLADFDWKIAAADLSFQESTAAYESLVDQAKAAFAENRRELQEIYRKVSESGAGAGPSTGGASCERGVFDPRDYKLPDLAKQGKCGCTARAAPRGRGVHQDHRAFVGLSGLSPDVLTDARAGVHFRPAPRCDQAREAREPRPVSGC